MLDFNSFSCQAPPFLFFCTWSPLQRLLVVVCTSWVHRDVRSFIACRVTYVFLFFLRSPDFTQCSATYCTGYWILSAPHTLMGLKNQVPVKLCRCKSVMKTQTASSQERKAWREDSLRTNQPLPTEFRAAYRKPGDLFAFAYLCKVITQHVLCRKCNS